MKRVICALLSIVLAFYLSGCEQMRVKTDGSWDEKRFKFSAKLEDENEYWIDYYDSLNKDINSFQENGEFKYFVSAPKAWHGKTYRLYSMITLPILKASKWILEIYDTDTKQLEIKEITYEQLGLTDEKDDGKLHYLTDMDWINESSYVFQWATVSESDGIYYQVSDKRIYADLNGDIRQIELWDKYKELGMSDTETYGGSFIPQSSCLCDGQGNIYQLIVKNKGMYLLTFDQNGNLIFEYQIPQNWEVVDHIRTDKDEIIYLLNDEKESQQRLLWIDVVNKMVKEVASIPIKKDTLNEITKLCGMIGNTIYYETAQGNAYSWDVISGKRSLFMNYEENNLPSYYGRLYILRNDNPPQIRLYRQKNKTNEQPEEWIVSVSKDNEKKQVQIELLVTDTGKGLITQAASTTTKKIPNDLYNFKDVTTKDQKDLLLNELIAGNGPDMLYVSRSDFIALAEKGLLLDVSTLLSKDTLNRLLPAALELGTYNDKLLGMPVCVKGSTILISSETWNQHKWNIDDMLRLMREHKLDGSLYYGNAQTCFAPMATFRMLIRNFLREPWLIDWEKGQCYFNGERFIEFLSLLKDAERDNDTEMWLANGKRIAYFDIAHKDFIYDFGYKEEIENGHYVGFPTAGDGGNYLDADGLLVVCKNTEKLDAIKDLLTGVLDDTIQKGADISVNKISLPETEISEEGKQNIGGHEIMILKSGKSSILVAKEFLESCVAAPLHENELENIIMEEVDPYFQGRKTAQEIAEIIQNRVQLYLDEK